MEPSASLFKQTPSLLPLPLSSSSSTASHSHFTAFFGSPMALDGSTAEAKLANAKALLTAAASFAATVVLARSVAQDLLPPQLREYFYDGFRSIFTRFSSQLTMVVEEMDGLGPNGIYEAAETYLATKVSPSTHRLKVSKPEKEDNITTTIESDQEVIDTFNGVKLQWFLVCNQIQRENFHNPRSPYTSVVRSFELCFHKKHREMVLKSYLPYVLQQAKELKQQAKTLKIFAVDYQNIYGSISDLWIPTNLDHPATFNKLAMDSEIKDFILRDLERFVKRKEFYRKVGKAWKRGYLLYGPPGTGKSSLIAAMANYLKFDVYDLELTELDCNSDLRKLLMGIANRSILVVEDIDCSIQFQDRASEAKEEESSSSSRRRAVTLSGMLNFIDGLWSSCGDERIIIFTTNHKEKLDPALLRPGRMDVHVHMSYCSPCGFRVLASNYLGIENHKLFPEIEESILTTKVTPAEVAEQLLKGDEIDSALRELIEFLKSKKIENEEAEAKIREAELEAREKEEEKKKAEKKGEENGTVA
ncbi:AAA-ATPase At3g50940-like [Momordica charantia]|uniref:AAA-ATPase At3g50940-like n=1 Tax=Momordica charantia TaxID=3673 RepID=A0A6J1BT42_MOMCH|nr:AAA-ATPase At3g50940-like [Momordica charantia]